MSREFPDWVNPWSAAEGRRVYRGTLPLSRMKRLLALVESDAGEARFTAAFSQDMDRRPVVDIVVEASLRLMCQASLEAYDEVITRQSSLAVIESEAEIERLEDGAEPVKTDSGRLAFLDLVEDELILGLPQVPRRPGLDAVTFESRSPDMPEVEEEAKGSNSPFAGLDRMLDDGKH